MSQPLVQELTPPTPRFRLAVWKNPDAVFAKLAAITEEYILFAAPKEADLDSAAVALQAHRTLPDESRAIPFAHIRKVVLNELETGLTVYYTKNGEEHASTSFDFTSSDDRDTFIWELKARTGGTFQETRKVLTPLTASIKPLLVAGVVAFVTWLLRLAAIEIAAGGTADISGRRAGIKRLLFWVIDIIGPTGVLIAGGLIFLLCIAALVQRVKNPPIFRILKRAR